MRLTIAPENRNDVLARVPHIVRTLVQIIVGILAFVAEIVSLIHEYRGSHVGCSTTRVWTIAEVIIEVLEDVADIVRTLVEIIAGTLALVSSIVRFELGFKFYVIDEKNNCLGIDKRLKIAALCLRALPDATFALHTINHYINWRFPYPSIPQTRNTNYSHQDNIQGGKKKNMHNAWKLAIVVFFFKSGGSGHFGQRVTTVNVLGGFWYFFSIQREISCWHQFCKNAISCGATDYCSGSTSRNITFLNELCPSNPPSATVFNFGIFLDAIQYGITRSMHFPTKFFYCVWWGVRNLRNTQKRVMKGYLRTVRSLGPQESKRFVVIYRWINFGTNMQTSSYVWENCFAIIVSLIGLLLFLYLLGNLQLFV
ncbi:cyclic nucleotide gated channel 1 [Prunus dulcis]|uniref:Cyclic nucleotide gated channel 1 n=1 Tax=Prunus dulcis TaxID=3755 RepID=A0A4Y1RBN3_PRUDU|nr:cyclic nucleotide gated channel 1 [Prunus dulcis]